MLERAFNSNKKSDLTAVEIYTKYADFIRKIIRARVNDENQADDIFQDLFLRLIVNPIGADVEHVERYLYRTAVNEIINSVRRNKKIETGVNRYIRNTDIINRQFCPEDSVINADEVSKTFQLIHEQCSKKESKRLVHALNQYYNEVWPIKETAVTRGIKNNTISRYVSLGIPGTQRAVTAAGGNEL